MPLPRRLRLIAVIALKADGVLPHAHMTVGVDEARHHPAAAGVNRIEGAFSGGKPFALTGIFSKLYYFPLVCQNISIFKIPSSHRQDPCILHKQHMYISPPIQKLSTMQKGTA